MLAPLLHGNLGRLNKPCWATTGPSRRQRRIMSNMETTLTAAPGTIWYSSPRGTMQNMQVYFSLFVSLHRPCWRCGLHLTAWNAYCQLLGRLAKPLAGLNVLHKNCLHALPQIQSLSLTHTQTLETHAAHQGSIPKLFPDFLMKPLKPGFVAPNKEHD